MSWVRKTDPPPMHECNPPVEEKIRLNHDSRSIEYLSPEGANKDDLWRCDDCQRLWQVVQWINDGDPYLGWQPASFWNRWKYPAPKHPWPEPTKEFDPPSALLRSDPPKPEHSPREGNS